MSFSFDIFPFTNAQKLKWIVINWPMMLCYFFVEDFLNCLLFSFRICHHLVLMTYVIHSTELKVFLIEQISQNCSFYRNVPFFNCTSYELILAK